MSKGSPLHAVYLLEGGTLVEHKGEVQSLTDLRDLEIQSPEHSTPGEFFGEDCLTNECALADTTIVAATDCTLLSVPPAVVWSVLREQRSHIIMIPFFSSDLLSKADQYLIVSRLVSWEFK